MSTIRFGVPDMLLLGSSGYFFRVLGVFRPEKLVVPNVGLAKLSPDKSFFCCKIVAKEFCKIYCEELVQVSIAAMWSWRILLAVNGFFWLVHMAVSSANSLVFVRGSSETRKSLQYVM
jgi:hypothetical protein